MPRGRNKDFLIYGIKAIFKKNWGIRLDSHEIDLSLSYGENFHILMDRYVKLRVSREDVDYL